MDRELSEFAMSKLLGKSISINVRKVLWTLEEIGEAYSHEEWGRGHKPTQTPSFLSLNPNGLVPVYQDVDITLWESNTICRYLAGKYERYDLLPIAPVKRAEVEQWMDWAATDLNTAWRYSFMALVRKHPDFMEDDEIEKSVRSWNRHIGILNEHLSSRTYVAGEGFTLADIVVGLCVNRWLMTPIKHANCPHILEYYERLKTRPAFMKYGCNGVA